MSVLRALALGCTLASFLVPYSLPTVLLMAPLVTGLYRRRILQEDCTSIAFKQDCLATACCNWCHIHLPGPPTYVCVNHELLSRLPAGTVARCGQEVSSTTDAFDIQVREDDDMDDDAENAEEEGWDSEREDWVSDEEEDVNWPESEPEDPEADLAHHVDPPTNTAAGLEEFDDEEEDVADVEDFYNDGYYDNSSLTAEMIEDAIIEEQEEKYAASLTTRKRSQPANDPDVAY